MNSQSNYLPLNVRYYIVAQADAGHKYDDVVDMTYEKYGEVISKGTVSKLRDKMEEELTLESKPKSGRPPKQSEATRDRMIQAVEIEPKLNACAIFRDKKLNPPGPQHLSTRQITRVLNQNGLLDTTSYGEKISQEDMDRRVLFCRDAQATNLNWHTVVFSDESDLFPDKCGKVHYRSYRGERVDVDYGYEYVHDPRKVKVWGTISAEHVGTITRYYDRMNADKYIGVLEENLISDFPLLRGTKTRKGKLSYMNDWAGPHRANTVKDWLKGHNVHVMDWPSYSPDLNPIENVWGFIKGELFKDNSTLTTADQTWEKIQKIWYSRVNSMLPELYNSLPNRIQKVIDLNGRRIV